jgi:Fur family peroxide stress response transcriptional regulator
VKKYSRQREAILTVLRRVHCHPTAAWIYDRVRQEIPNISLGTVYRNLSELKRSGEILSFTPADGVERFDGDTAAHDHMVCISCGAVLDIPHMDFTPFMKAAEESSHCTITGGEILFYGICPHCQMKK